MAGTFSYHYQFATSPTNYQQGSAAQRMSHLVEKIFHKVFSEENISTMTEYSLQVKRTNSSDELTGMNSYEMVSRYEFDYQESGCKSHAIQTKVGSKKKAREMDFVNNFKTEICKYWEQKGHCHFGEKCAFAHGAHELRQKLKVLSGYKAKKCVRFHIEGYCPYGRRCQFLHSLRNQYTQIEQEKRSYEEKMSDPSFFESQQSECICKMRPRLPIFEGITDDRASCSHSSQ